MKPKPKEGDEEVKLRSMEEKQAIWERLNELVKEGKTRSEAEKLCGVGQTYYYILKRIFDGAAPKGRRGRKPKVEVLTLPKEFPKRKESPVFVFYGSPDAVSEIVRSLQ